MQNKKIMMVIMTILSVVIFVATYFIITQSKKQEKLLTAKNNSKQCTYSSDQAAYEQMISLGDKDACDCIRNEELKVSCMAAVDDMGFYKKALADLNADLCGNIKDDISKESCTLAVKDALENIPTDPGLMPEKKIMSIEDYERIRKEDPQNVENLSKLAIAYARKGRNWETGMINESDMKKALDILELAKKIEPGNAQIYLAEGDLYNLSLQNDQAIISYEKSLEIDPKNTKALIGKARSYAYGDKITEAIAELEKAANLDFEVKNNEIYLNLCNLYAKNANREKAMKNCSIIINGANDESLKAMARESANSFKQK